MAVRAKLDRPTMYAEAPLKAVPDKRAMAALVRSRTPKPGHSSEAEFQGYKELIRRAVEVFGNDLKASRWLSSPSVDLEGKVPLEVAQDVLFSAPELQRIFEPVFIRMEHGIYT